MIEATGLAIVKMVQWLNHKLTGDDPRQWRLELHDAGFRCFARKRCDDVRWSEVCLIRTYRRDVAWQDVVCILIESKSGVSVEIDEKMKGFGAILKRIEQEFPSIPTDWYETIMFPPFAQKERVLWRSGHGN